MGWVEKRTPKNITCWKNSIKGLGEGAEGGWGCPASSQLCGDVEPCPLAALPCSPGATAPSLRCWRGQGGSRRVWVALWGLHG